MSYRNHNHNREFPHWHNREHHPRVSIGIFFIVLGLALLVATNDVLGLGSVAAYFTWQTVLIFLGVLMLLNLHFMGGFVLIALGIWFLKDQLNFLSPELFKIYFWPAVIGLVGLSFILSSLFRKKNHLDN